MQVILIFEKELIDTPNARQIIKYQTNKGLIEFIDHLNMANEENLANIHNKSSKNGYISCITMNIGDYSKGTGDKFSNAKVNLSAEEIRWLAKNLEPFGINSILPVSSEVTSSIKTANERLRKMNLVVQKKLCETNEELAVKIGSAIESITGNFDKLMPNDNVDVRTFDYSFDRIYESTNGTSVTRASIKRTPYITISGETSLMKLPWQIIIANGTGTAAKTNTGGTYLKQGSFKELSKTSIRLSDKDIFCLFNEVANYISLWENVYASALVTPLHEPKNNF